MKRLLTLLALAGLSAAAGACGDDSGDDDDTKVDAGSDAGKDAGKDGGGDGGARGQQIATESLGDACGAVSECSGAGALQCLKMLPTLSLTGGYCTAECTASSECGPNGKCPSGDAITNPMVPAANHAQITGVLPTICLTTCEVGDAGGQGNCRAGYVCDSLATLVPVAQRGAFGALAVVAPAFALKYCLPGASPGDAGTSALILGGIDSGL